MIALDPARRHLRPGLLTRRRQAVWSLRTRLIVFSLLLLVPPISLSFFLVQENITRAHGQVTEGALATVEVVAGTTDDFVANAERMLATISREDSLRRRDSAEANDFLAKLIPHLPNFINLVATDEYGTPFASAIWEDPRLAQDPGRIVLRDVLASGQQVVSGRLTGRYLGQPAVVIAVPIRDVYGRRVGSLGGVVSLAALQRTLAGVRVGEHALITVVDAQGNLLVHPDLDQLYASKDVTPLPPVRQVMAGERGLLEYADPSDGKHWLAAFAPTQQAPWAVVVFYPANTAYVSVEEVARRGLLYLAIAAVVAIALLALESRTVTRPIANLAQDARHLSARYSLSQAEDQVSDELDQLSRTIHLLSTNLDENLNELSRSRQEVGTISSRLRRAMVRAGNLRDEERKRIARDIHDTAAQFVVAALLEAGKAESALHSDPASAALGLQRAQELLRQSVAELERVIFDLRPPSLLAGSLTEGLRIYLARFTQLTGLDCALEVEGEERPLGETLNLAALRIVQEALHNVRKHAATEHADVRIVFDQDWLTVTVSDQGCGFAQPPERAKASRYGLNGMDERAASVGGRLDVESTPGVGTTVRFAAPICKDDAGWDGQPARARPLVRGAAP